MVFSFSETATIPHFGVDTTKRSKSEGFGCYIFEVRVVMLGVALAIWVEVLMFPPTVQFKHFDSI